MDERRASRNGVHWQELHESHWNPQFGRQSGHQLLLDNLHHHNCCAFHQWSNQGHGVCFGKLVDSNFTLYCFLVVHQSIHQLTQSNAEECVAWSRSILRHYSDRTNSQQIFQRLGRNRRQTAIFVGGPSAVLHYLPGFVLTIIFVFPLFLIPFFPLAVIFVLFFLCFRAGIRSLKRTENITRSPLFDHITVSLDGLSTIHAFSQSQRFFDAFKSKLDENSSAMFMFNAAMRWQAVWLDM